MVFPAEIAEKKQSIGGEQAAGRACQMLCGFAALNVFSMPITREGEDIQIIESHAERVYSWVILLGSSNAGYFGSDPACGTK